MAWHSCPELPIRQCTSLHTSRNSSLIDGSTERDNFPRLFVCQVCGFPRCLLRWYRSALYPPFFWVTRNCDQSIEFRRYLLAISRLKWLALEFPQHHHAEESTGFCPFLSFTLLSPTLSHLFPSAKSSNSHSSNPFSFSCFCRPYQVLVVMPYSFLYLRCYPIHSLSRC